MTESTATKLTPDEYARLQAEVQAGLKRLTEHAEIVFREAQDRGETYTVHYWRYYRQYEEEVLTLEEAVAYVEGGESAGDLAGDYISGPGGSRFATDGTPLAADRGES
jgi:hypothetical protein